MLMCVFVCVLHHGLVREIWNSSTTYTPSFTCTYICICIYMLKIALTSQKLLAESYQNNTSRALFLVPTHTVCVYILTIQTHTVLRDDSSCQQRATKTGQHVKIWRLCTYIYMQLTHTHTHTYFPVFTDYDGFTEAASRDRSNRVNTSRYGVVLPTYTCSLYIYIYIYTYTHIGL